MSVICFKPQRGKLVLEDGTAIYGYVAVTATSTSVGLMGAVSREVSMRMAGPIRIMQVQKTKRRRKRGPLQHFGGFAGPLPCNGSESGYTTKNPKEVTCRRCRKMVKGMTRQEALAWSAKRYREKR